MTTNDFEAMIAAYQFAANNVATLENRIANPICGKPGYGFKAARKLRKDLPACRSALGSAQASIASWITRNNKASAQERQRRLERVKQYISDWSN